MELRAYLRVLRTKWWIVLPTFLITFTATLVLTFAQTPIYESTATFIVKLDASFQGDKSFVSALDILSRRAEIVATYTEVATSRLIKKQAADALRLTAEQKDDLSVASRAVAGTNVLEISVQGSDPVLVRDFANAIGDQTVAYVQSVYETYVLESLDPATTRSTPIKPNKVLNLALGGIFGLILAAGLAFLSVYLLASPEKVTNFDILDDETGVHNWRYFAQRLRQEMSRAKRNNYSLSVALMNVDHRGVMEGIAPEIRRGALHRVAMLLGPCLREEDVMARFNAAVFAFLLPDVPGETAKETMESLRTRITSIPLEIDGSGHKLNLHTTVGVVDYQGQDIEQDALLAKAIRALEDAEGAAYEKVYLFSENGNRRRRSIAKTGTNR